MQGHKDICTNMFTASLVPGSTQGAAALIETNSSPLKVLCLVLCRQHMRKEFSKGGRCYQVGQKQKLLRLRDIRL